MPNCAIPSKSLRAHWNGRTTIWMIHAINSIIRLAHAPANWISITYKTIWPITMPSTYGQKCWKKSFNCWPFHRINCHANRLSNPPNYHCNVNRSVWISAVYSNHLHLTLAVHSLWLHCHCLPWSLFHRLFATPHAIFTTKIVGFTFNFFFFVHFLFYYPISFNHCALVLCNFRFFKDWIQLFLQKFMKHKIHLIIFLSIHVL